MNTQRTVSRAVVLGAASLLVLALVPGQVQAFRPQPEPPGKLQQQAPVLPQVQPQVLPRAPAAIPRPPAMPSVRLPTAQPKAYPGPNFRGTPQGKSGLLGPSDMTKPGAEKMGIIIQDKPAEFMPSAPGKGGKFLAPGSTKMFRPQPEPPGKAKMGFEPSPFMPKGASLGPEGGTPVGITPEPERGEGGSPVAVSSEPLPRAPEMMPQGAGEKGIIILNKPGQGSEKMGIIVSDRPAEFIPSAPGKGSEKMGIIVSDKPGPAGGEKGIIVIGTEPGEGAAPGLGGMGEKGIIIINKPGQGAGEKGIIINSAPTPAGK